MIEYKDRKNIYQSRINYQPEASVLTYPDETFQDRISPHFTFSSQSKRLNPTEIITKDRQFFVRVEKIGLFRSLCEIDFGGFPVYAKLPSKIIKELGLKKYKKFLWEIPQDGKLKASDCSLLEQEVEITNQKVEETIKFLKNMKTESPQYNN